MTLGEKIRISMAKKSMSQQDLSEKAGTHQKNISKYEKDLVVPSALTLKSMADALDVSLEYLVGEGIISNFDKKTLQRIEDIDLLEDDKKKTLFDVIDTFTREAKGRKAFAS